MAPHPDSIDHLLPSSHRLCNVDDNLTFASLTQWFSLFCNGIISEEGFSIIHIGFETASYPLPDRLGV